MPEPLIRIEDVAYPRLRVPDLDAMEAFLTDFGLVRCGRTDDALYMAGAHGGPPLHVVEEGDPGLVGFAFRARSREDLERIAAAPGASPVHAIKEPGGGHRVTLVDPHGFVIEIVHGRESASPLRPEPSMALNLGARVERRGEVKRVARRPAHVLRLGHLGINVPDPDVTFGWYHAHLGILKSDTVAVGDVRFAHFCRCDRGAEPTDHHTFLIARSLGDPPGLNHASWEVGDLDDIWVGHEHLAQRGYRHTWGIGRHTLGSQIFDYWRDPWGHIHEHFTDGDLVNDAHVPAVHPPDAVASQWGPQMPPDFGRPPSS